MSMWEKVIMGLERCIEKLNTVTNKTHGFNCTACPYFKRCESSGYLLGFPLMKDALALLKAQEPRVMTLGEVEARPYGYVLIETDKKGSLRWVDALLFCKNTNFSFDFITMEGRARLLGAEYNKEWRCWTSRPTDEQREEVKWDG